MLHIIMFSYISARPNSSKGSFLSAVSSVLRSIFNIFYHAKCRSIARTFILALYLFMKAKVESVKEIQRHISRYRFPDENYIF